MERKLSKIAALLLAVTFVFGLFSISGYTARPVQAAAASSASISTPWLGYVNTSSSNLNVRKGAGTGYAVVASLPKGTKVQIIGVSGSWYKVYYNTSKSVGYVSGSYIAVSSKNYGTVKTSGSNLILRSGASVNSGRLASIPNGTALPLISTGQSSGFYRVCYGTTVGYVSGTYFNTGSTSSSNSTLAYYSSHVGTVIANTAGYVTNLDGYTGIKGQCVWYVRNRGYEKLGNRGLTGIGGNANTWYSTARSRNLSTGSTPRSNSIACWNGGQYGHVAFVEYYDSASQTVYFTEGNWSNTTNGVLKKLSLSQFKSRMGGYQGCIYLE